MKILFALLIALAATPTTLATGGSKLSPATAIESYLDDCAQFGWSGSVHVQRKGKLVFGGGFGLADRETGRANQADTVYELASITKPITACVVIALAEKGRIDLDESIAEYLPNVPAEARAITPRHLLSHTSGYPRSATDGRGDDLAAAVEAYLAGGPSSKPGTKHEYWNGGYALLAGIIERVTEGSYMRAVQKYVYGPAKMKRAGFTGDKISAKLQAIGYEAKAEQRLATDHPYGSYGYHYLGMGGAVASAQDLARFAEAFMNAKLFKPDLVKEMLKPVKQTYGLGWGTFDGGFAHGGDVRGFHGDLRVLHKDQLIVALLSNVGGIPAWRLSKNVEALALGKSMPYPQPPSTKKWKARDLQALAGQWYTAEGTGVSLAVEEGALSLSPQGLELSALLKGERSAAGGGDVTVRFAEEIFGWVRENERKEIEKSLGSGIPSTWVDRIFSTWKKQGKEIGEFERAWPVLSKDKGGGRTEVFLALKHKLDTRFAKIGIRGGKFVFFSLEETGPSDRWILAPVKRGLLVSYDWAGKGAALRLSFSGKANKAKQLTLGHGEDQEIRLQREGPEARKPKGRR